MYREKIAKNVDSMDVVMTLSKGIVIRDHNY